VLYRVTLDSHCPSSPVKVLRQSLGHGLRKPLMLYTQKDWSSVGILSPVRRKDKRIVTENTKYEQFTKPWGH